MRHVPQTSCLSNSYSSLEFILNHSKNFVCIVFSALALLAITACVSSEKQVESTPQEPIPAFTRDAVELVSTIAFGSCNNSTLPQPLWKPIMANNPDLWIWTGDIIYADGDPPESVVEKYRSQKNQADYARLSQTTQILGIWDDHDYGLNNGGKEYEDKSNSQKRLLDFLNVPLDHPRRKREGAYDAVTYGPSGQRVKIILLDCRYHREAPGPETDILGEAQWTWLENELRNSDARVHIIGAGIQVVSSDHPFESWGQFPKAQKRLYQLIGDTKAPGVIFISGDRHLAEISMIPDTPAGYPIHDITSSGMTHSYDSFTGEPNRHRVSEVFAKLNFGMILINWETGVLNLQIRDQQNEAVISRQVELGKLAP